MAQMTKSEIKKFLMKDTFTGKLATVKKKWKSACCSNLVYCRRNKQQKQNHGRKHLFYNRPRLRQGKKYTT